MAFSYRDLFFGGTTFCCCLPVRMGIISMSLLGILVAGVLSIILWFEVATTLAMTPSELAAFILAGILETILFAASILGFVGAIVRKQTFIQTYAYILYFHFAANVGVAIYLLVMILRFQSNLTVEACEDTIQDPGAQSQCTGLLQITKTIYIVIASIVLVVEFYGAIIAARYVNQIKREKVTARASRMDVETAFRLKSSNKFMYTSVNSAEQYAPLYDTAYQPEFNPYTEIEAVQPISQANDLDGDRPPHPIGVGYGGGSWTHEDISEEEKARLRQQDREGAINPENGSDSDLTEQEREQQRSEVKSALGRVPSPTQELDAPPQYTVSTLPK